VRLSFKKQSTKGQSLQKYLWIHYINILIKYSARELGGGGAQGDGTPLFFFFFLRTPTIFFHRNGVTPRSS
jgi:hypothetical protein